MRDYAIVVPSCKLASETANLLGEIHASDTKNLFVYSTGLKVAAAVNRNFALSRIAKSVPYVVMVDDDITGFSKDWADTLVETLRTDLDIVMVSARLMNSDGGLGCMMSIEPDLSSRFQTVDGYLPSACIAIRNDGTRFDEEFIGSGWEDTDFCDSLHVKYPNGKFVIDNNVKVVHANEMKYGDPVTFERNRQYYLRKHGRIQ